MFRWLRLLSSRARKERADAALPYLAALERGDFASAEELLTRAIDAADPAARPFLFNKRGVARVNLERRDGARADFEAALESNARYAPALTNLANLLFDEGRIEEALDAYRMAVAADPDHPLTYANLSAALKRAGRYDESVRAMRTARRLEGRKRSRPTERP
ncbi:MAG: tetratricopeptide repeat protein [Candidatus Eremiobacteraeota bacterium]|nr:tetratricopeptide repeat protein [Candidatus Eremiobacteraeota bacterium]